LQEFNVKQVIVGACLTIGSLIGFFWWGIHFSIFSSKIDWAGRPAQLGFPILLITAMFGFGYMAGGFRSGQRFALQWTVILLAAAIIGFVRTQM